SPRRSLRARRGRRLDRQTIVANPDGLATIVTVRARTGPGARPGRPGLSSRRLVRSRTTISVLMTDISVVCIVCGTRSRDSCSPRDRLWLRGPVLRGHFGLARTPTRALARHDRAADQQLATPDTPG